MEGVSMVRIDRKSSIESEPRTLGFDQIQYAREAALYVLNTKTIEEAMTIFMKGLEPVVSTARHNENTMIDTEDEELESTEDQLRLPAGRRDIASAPF
ncbi:uncharacterized protein LOC115950870 isoform X4 [Quercus lobata]|uniref:Uncharacterized protein n=1 Tax=Quercus lobata TaxID=97700 RepID=A0A7N2LYM5_QUELO|nr:uncharacterized protein LOC115950870 isoform X3 [Quercus lobata]XP_030924004.1 uncharacterized protein LOC115950870 isoform X4 [Quercus lobata]